MVRSTRDHEESTPAGLKAKADAIEADKTAADVQKQVDEDQARGYRGIEVDPTPNDAYTVQGVTSGAATPETDDAAAEEARKAQTDVARKATGVGGR